jgi:hypothetical protein
MGKKLSPDAQMGRNLHVLTGHLIGVANLSRAQGRPEIEAWAEEIKNELLSKYAHLLRADTAWLK